MKFDTDKPQLQLVPAFPLLEISRVFGFGAKKYGQNNWRRDADLYGWTRHYCSIQRHLNAWIDGEDLDPESGMPHLAHATTQLMILLQLTKDAPQCDDRFKKESAI
jgi:hypothetical protein